MVGSLTVPEIARAFLVQETAMSRRITRAKAKIKAARIPYRLPSRADLPARVTGVLAVLYLIFNEGYLASGPGVPDGVTARSLYKVPVICVAHRDHPVAAARSLRLGDLAAHRLAVHSWGAGADELDEMLRAARIPPTRVCWVSPSATALALAVEHGHIAVLPADAAAAQLRSGVLSRVRITSLPRWSLDVVVAYRDGFEERASANVVQLLTRTGTQIAATFPR